MALIDHTQLTHLRELAGGDHEFVASVIEAFLPQLKATPPDLRRALDDGDAHAVVELAHSLKGSAGNVGAEDVGRLCLAIERRARDGRLGEVPSLVEELEASAAATHDAYEAEQARRP